MRRVLFATLLSVIASLHPSFALDAAAQSVPVKGKVHGTVLDPTKAPIVGAVVTASSTEGPAQPASTTTNGSESQPRLVTLPIRPPRKVS